MMITPIMTPDKPTYDSAESGMNVSSKRLRKKLGAELQKDLEIYKEAHRKSPTSPTIRNLKVIELNEPVRNKDRQKSKLEAITPVSSYRTSQQQEDPFFQPETNVWEMTLQYIIMGAAIACASTEGIFYYCVQPRVQLLKAVWRTSFLILGLIGLMIYEFIVDRKRLISWCKPLISETEIKSIMMSSLGHVMYMISLVVALNNTSMAQATLLIGMAPAVLLVVRVLKNIPMGNMEMIGGILSAIGMILIVLDENISSNGYFVDLSISNYYTREAYGTSIALFGAIGGALYCSKNYKLSYDYTKIPIYLAIFILDFLALSIISVIVYKADFSMSPHTGIFGSFSEQWLWINVFSLSVIALGVYIGISVSPIYFKPPILAVMNNSEPFYAILIMLILGWQPFPGLNTTIAFFAIGGGLSLIVMGERRFEIGRFEQFEIIDRRNLSDLPMIKVKSEETASTYGDKLKIPLLAKFKTDEVNTKSQLIFSPINRITFGRE